MFVTLRRKLFLSLLFIPQIVVAQTFPVQQFPNHLFRSPLNIPITLAGGYGEIRPGHFHEGLDMKTEGRIGLPVHAAAAGYISRVAISNTGFGHVIYITHPDGYTTVYGHLHRFSPDLEKYVKQKQYKQESWAIDLHLSPGQFPVKQGQFIAYSGATGSVAGPHVHFEIRNTKTEHPLNGLLFGFDIKDNIPPTIYRIALYNMNKSIYEQTPDFYEIRKENGIYVPSKNLLLFNGNEVGFGVQALDHMNNTTSSFGIYEEILYDDGKPQIGFQLNNIGYDETRYVDAHTDYKTFKETGRHFELLFSLPGNKLPVYYTFEGNGTIHISDGKVHAIKILVRDADDNTSTVKFNVRKNPAYKVSFPNSCANTMYVNSRNIFENNNVQFNLEPGTLYDSICFNYHQISINKPGYYSDIFQLGNSDIPLYYPFRLSLKPQKPVPDSLRNKVIIVRQDTHGR
ncbi:MAG: M23 family metallopeptidase, partial [Chitinophagaceae bacterium]